VWGNVMRVTVIVLAGLTLAGCSGYYVNPATLRQQPNLTAAAATSEPVRAPRGRGEVTRAEPRQMSVEAAETTGTIGGTSDGWTDRASRRRTGQPDADPQVDRALTSICRGC